MTVLMPRDKRRSRHAFDWTARSALERNSLDAITGQVATFTRASVGTSLGSDGLLVNNAHSQPRYQWVSDAVSGLTVPAALLEAAATNVVLWNRDLTNAAWTKTNVTAAKTQTGIDGIANSASKITASAGNGTCLQAITLGSSSRRQTAWVKRVTGSGTINMTTDNGSTWTAITVTSSWTRVSIPAQTLANPTVGFRIVTNGDAIAVDYAQNETGPIYTSVIATTTVAVTRAADVLSFACNLAPQAMTVYPRFVEMGTYGLSGAARVFELSDASGTAEALLMYAAPYTIQHSAAAGTSESAAAAATTVGDTVELRGVMQSDGAVYLGQAINAAAEVVAATGTARAFSSAFSGTYLTCNGYGPSATVPGAIALISLRFGLGVQTLATMREG